MKNISSSLNLKYKCSVLTLNFSNLNKINNMGSIACVKKKSVYDLRIKEEDLNANIMNECDNFFNRENYQQLNFVSKTKRIEIYYEEKKNSGNEMNKGDSFYFFPFWFIFNYFFYF